MALITTAQLKSYLKITTNDLDTFLATLIDQAENEITYYVGTALGSSSKTALFGGNSLSIRYMGKLLVTAISSLSYRVTPLDSYVTISSIDYTFYEENGLHWLHYDGIFTAGYQYKVVYTSGYTTIPSDLQAVCLEMCAVKYRDSRQGQNTLGQASVVVNVAGVNSQTSYISLWDLSWKKRLVPFRIVPA